MSTIQRKLGTNIDGLIGVSSLDALPLIKDAGFETFFTGVIHAEQVAAIKQRADELGLEFAFIHAPFRGINDMWLSGLGYLNLFNPIKESIDSAAASGIPMIILHVSSGWNAPAVNDLGLSRYDELVLYAKEKGVTIAFENLRMTGNLTVLMERYARMDNVRYCFDCGHEYCYTKTISWVDLFADKLCCTHIHDNHSRAMDDKGSDRDEHLLPFDGTYDYEQMMRRLDHYGYTGSLMLEISQHVKPEYKAMKPEEFLATAYERIKKISEM